MAGFVALFQWRHPVAGNRWQSLCHKLLPDLGCSRHRHAGTEAPMRAAPFPFREDDENACGRILLRWQVSKTWKIEKEEAHMSEGIIGREGGIQPPVH